MHCDGSPFDLHDDASYRRWREWKLACAPRGLADQLVDVADPRVLTASESDALRAAVVRGGVAIYRSRAVDGDSALPRLLAAQLGMHRLDANWLAGEDGVSRITVSRATDGHGGFIPYTDRAIGWHTDGYYHPEGRRIRGMVLHCVRPAARGGATALLDPRLAYIALRDRDPALVHALMQPDAMSIPERTDEAGVDRAVQAGPVFSVDEAGALHMRYTARTRSIAWRDDDATREAAARLRQLLHDSPHVQRIRLEAGMGIAGHNVLHERTAFVDDPARPRLLLRARFVDRVWVTGEDAWRNG
ncbi:MAG: TauD/TfdA family dioxygenase [Burkholderiales bacterium]|nr:TauD/TfdA family dioxygenase [Burkholderiales bacterium]